MRLKKLATTVALGAVALIGCDDATEPDMATVAGSYQATTFVGHTETGDIDVLAEGGSLTMTLTATGTTTGSLFVPGGEEDGTDAVVDLSGTWTLDGDEVTFDHDSDTFLRDVTFTYEGGRLISSSVYADVVLTRD